MRDIKKKFLIQWNYNWKLNQQLVCQKKFDVNPIRRYVMRWKEKKRKKKIRRKISWLILLDSALMVPGQCQPSQLCDPVILNLYFYADSTGHPGTWRERESSGRLTIRAPEGVAASEMPNTHPSNNWISLVQVISGDPKLDPRPSTLPRPVVSLTRYDSRYFI